MAEQKQRLPAPELASLILEMALASKVLAHEIRRAALVGRLGLAGGQNPTGDSQKKLDVYANEVVVDAFVDSGMVAAIVSEEMDELRTIACNDEAGYLLCVDPLDGSSNTDINGALGTIFSFYRRETRGACLDCEGELREGLEMVAAGYVMFGPSTVLVYSIGGAVHGFTLEQDVGEYLLSHPDIRCPTRGRYFAANLGNYHAWDANVRGFSDHALAPDSAGGVQYSYRYSGALAADFHRSLLEGGIYLYPADDRHPEGKLRLLYECAPLAFVAEQAGGSASSGSQRVLDIRPRSLHDTTPFAVGSREDVELYERFVAGGRP
jgi:fructose-1,6-bisphosphatase I